MTDSQGGSRPVDPLRSEPAGVAPPSPITDDPRLEGPATGRPESWVAAEPRGQDSTKDAAKDEAGRVKNEAMAGGQHVAGVAKTEARNVTAEAGQQAKHLWHQTRSELMDQAGQQQQRAAGGLKELGAQLGAMADNSDDNGLATDLVRQGSTKAHAAAQWLEGRDPGSVMEEVRGFARRKPGVFLAAAAALGFVAARMGRGLQAEHQNQSPTGETGISGRADVYSAPGADVQAAPGPVAAPAPYGEQLP